MPSRSFVIGTRGSRLAMRQTHIALDALRAANPGVSLDTRTIRTSGDQSTASLAEIGGRGVFVMEIERALLAGGIDVAVHSLKDLPSEETDGLSIAAILERDDPRDVLISRTGAEIGDLPSGTVVGTGSPRRAVQILAFRSDIKVRDIRGNVDTRIRKVEQGDYDAVVLAAAGLQRLGWLDRAAQVFEPEDMLPSVGQGALAIQIRSDDGGARELAAGLDHFETGAAVIAERAFERRLRGGCHATIAAYATVGQGPDRERTPVTLRGLVGPHPGAWIGVPKLLRGEMEGVAAEAEMLGVRLAEFFIAQGATDLMGVAK